MPEMLGLTLFVPICHGRHHSSYEFPPKTISQVKAWYGGQDIKKGTVKDVHSHTWRPRISSMDCSCSTILQAAFDVWGLLSLLKWYYNMFSMISIFFLLLLCEVVSCPFFGIYLAKILLMFSASFSCKDRSLRIVSLAFSIAICC